jgi:hypothetical protein
MKRVSSEWLTTTSSPVAPLDTHAPPIAAEQSIAFPCGITQYVKRMSAEHSCWVEHDLFGRPASAFPDHALKRT